MSDQRNGEARRGWQGMDIGSVIQRLARPNKTKKSFGTLAASMPGVRYTDRTAAERYEVLPDYQRFDQKYNMTRQGVWNPDAIQHSKAQMANRKKFVQARKPGYSLLDYGFFCASQANQKLTGFGINCPNQGATTWQRIGPPVPEGMKWNGDPKGNALAVKKIARLYGAGDVGVTTLDRRWVYAKWFDDKTKDSYPIRFSDEPGYEHITEPTQAEDMTQIIPASMTNVVVMILPMYRMGMRAAPTLTQYGATQMSYSAISRLVASVAEFIRGLGYNAIPSSNCTALNIPLAIDAGMGELGRNAKLIHPVWGPLCRVCKIITDLPLALDSPIETGATAFCDTCGKCAETCPTRSVPEGPRTYEPRGVFSGQGVRAWQLQHDSCYEFWGKAGTNCGICLRVCPFSKGQHWSHTATKWAIANLPGLNPHIVSLDDAFGYGEQRIEGFWEDDDLFDLG